MRNEVGRVVPDDECPVGAGLDGPAVGVCGGRRARISRTLEVATLLCLVGASWDTRGSDEEVEFDWKRDQVVLADGDVERGIVMEAWPSRPLVLLRESGKRDEIPWKEIQRIDTLRQRLADFMGRRSSESTPALDWELSQFALANGLPHMARLQAYRVLTQNPAHSGANELLGHKKSGKGYRWRLGKKFVDSEDFDRESGQWNDRLVLESEHFALETNAGLQSALNTLFDFETLYLWWMEHIGPHVLAAEDVDLPNSEKITFFIHANKDEPSFSPLNSLRQPYYDPSGDIRSSKDGINVARTYYEAGYRPAELFELATQALVYSTLVLGKVRGGALDISFHRHSYWVELGLGHWVARHCDGKPGRVVIRPPFQQPFELDEKTAKESLTKLPPSSDLRKASHEVTNLIGLDWDDFWGTADEIPLLKARVASFTCFLLESDHPVQKSDKAEVVGRSRAGLYHYLREVYGTPRSHSSDAFDAGLGGKVQWLDKHWKDWTRRFAEPQSKRK